MNWYSFWQKYRLVDIASDRDLLFQVGKTVNGTVINKDHYELLVHDTVELLHLTSDDVVLDLCCGNGILTFELSKYVSKVIGIDFSEPFIENAKKYKSTQKIEYICADVKKLTEVDFSQLGKINKVLIYDALAYFSYSEIDLLLSQLAKVLNGKEIILFASVLNRHKIWSFFNTLTRKLRYWIQFRLFKSNYGIGKWWLYSEFQALSEKNSFDVEIHEQDAQLYTSHYRMDVVLTGRG